MSNRNLNILADLAGAAAMAAYMKHRVKKDFANGEDYSSAIAAGTFFAAGAMRQGRDSMISLGGLYGVRSALEDIERTEQKGSESAAVASQGADLFTEHFKLFKMEAYKVLEYTMDYSDEYFNPDMILCSFIIGVVYQLIKRCMGTRLEKAAMMDDILSKIDIGIAIQSADMLYQIEDLCEEERPMLPYMARMLTDLENGGPKGWIILNRAGGTYNLETKREVHTLVEAVSSVLGVGEYLEAKYPAHGFMAVAANYTDAAIDYVQKDFSENITLV